jgi:ParB family chromosome partitioning protein
MAGFTGKRPAMGRGLESLLGPLTNGASSISEIDLAKIDPNPDQPRSIFEEESLEELAASVRSVGVIQPITVKEQSGGRYLIISGERHYRAAQKAGLTRIPAYVKTAADEDVTEMALIENIQREDLNAIEIALAYQKLIETFGLTQEKLSERVGKKRTTIANYLRLLNLPTKIQMGLKDKKIDMGHARALLPVEDAEVQEALYEQIVNENLSVRMVEEMVRNLASGEAIAKAPVDGKESAKPRHAALLPEEYKPLKEQLSHFFKTKVQLTYNDKGKGKISIPFSSVEDFERLMGLFDKMRQAAG